MPRPIVALVGATASGKTGLSLDLAERLGGEVVNTDAMQVYRGMDIGTAKLPPAERRGIAHHLLDILDVTEPATVAQFQVWARDAIGDIRGRGATPVLVGGSALYTRAIIDRFEFPGTDESLRRELEAELERVGSPALHAPAGRRRPDGGRPDHPRQRAPRRTSPGGHRAHRPALQRQPPAPGVRRPADVQIGVDIDRPTLDERIAQRVDEMFAGGFVEEVEALLARGLARGAYRAPRDRLPRGHRLPRRRPDAGRGDRADQGRHPALLAAPGRVVPQGPAHRLGRPRRPRPRGRRRSRAVESLAG